MANELLEHVGFLFEVASDHFCFNYISTRYIYGEKIVFLLHFVAFELLLELTNNVSP